MHADGEHAGDFVRGQHRADREAAAQAFRARQDVGHDTLLHVGKERAGTAHAALDLVQDQERAVGRRQPPRRVQELRRARNHAPFTLHRLQDHRADLVAGLREYLLQRRHVVVRDVREAGRIGAESRRVLRLAAGGDREQRAPVEAVERGDHADLPLAELVVRIAAGELQRRLVGLGARIAEEHALGERVLDQPLRETQRRLAGQPVRHVPQRARLVGDRADHRRVAMAERSHGHAAREVDVHPPVLVPHARAFPAYGDERGRRIALHHQRVEVGAGDGHRGGGGGQRGDLAPRGRGDDGLGGCRVHRGGVRIRSRARWR